MKTSTARATTGKMTASPIGQGPAITDNRATAAKQREMQEAIAGSPRQQALHRKANKTGLPDSLKRSVENLSGHSLDDVKVHYNSARPAELQAHAYAQGSDIHVAPGQEQHLPHEAWHVVQQKQGRVQPTRQLKGKHAINDDAGLEREADAMGAKALGNTLGPSKSVAQRKVAGQQTAGVIQRDACYIPSQASPYAGIGKKGNVGPGENFDSNQRFAILQANYVRSMKKFTFAGGGDIQKDDETNEDLIDLGTISGHVAAIDHIVPRAKGGGNTELNAQVLSAERNSSKGDAYPWGSYNGYRVYDPAQGKIYKNAVAARAGGADMTTLDAKGW